MKGSTLLLLGVAGAAAVVLLGKSSAAQAPTPRPSPTPPGPASLRSGSAAISQDLTYSLADVQNTWPNDRAISWLVTRAPFSFFVDGVNPNNMDAYIQSFGGGGLGFDTANAACLDNTSGVRHHQGHRWVYLSGVPRRRRPCHLCRQRPADEPRRQLRQLRRLVRSAGVTVRSFRPEAWGRWRTS